MSKSWGTDPSRRSMSAKIRYGLILLGAAVFAVAYLEPMIG